MSLQGQGRYERVSTGQSWHFIWGPGLAGGSPQGCGMQSMPIYWLWSKHPMVSMPEPIGRSWPSGKPLPLHPLPPPLPSPVTPPPLHPSSLTRPSLPADPQPQAQSNSGPEQIMTETFYAYFSNWKLQIIRTYLRAYRVWLCALAEVLSTHQPLWGVEVLIMTFNLTIIRNWI